MKETYYFSHDYNARNDEKILRLIQKEGWAGYGIFWALIEKLYEAGGFLTKDYETIAFDLRTDSERIKAIIDSDLFEISKDKFYSKSCLARLRDRKGKSEKARQSAFLRWNKPNKDDANALRTQSEGNAIKERKGKERKVKEIIQQPVVAEVNSLLDVFYKFNPSTNFGNKTQREAIQWFLSKYGFEKTKATIEYALSIQGEKFSPLIVSPLQLKNKIGELLVYHKKNNSPKGGITII